ncbi:MAG TPA: replicative DNA helicase [Limnochordia bacterium]|nr:replicative DNA helicase [Limnochordia bacterium]
MAIESTAGPERRYIPQDPDAERRVLGILIKYPNLIDTAIERLKPHHFYERAHRIVFEAVLDLYNRQGRISYTQAYNQLRRDDRLQDPEQVLLALTQSFASEAELGPSIEILLDRAAKRLILAATDEIRQMIWDETEASLADYQAKAQQLIFQATSVETSEEVKDLLEVLNTCYMRLLERREGRRLPGLPVRLPSLDMMTTGFKNKDLIILAARPSMGKTSLALNFCVNVAKRGVPSLVFSLEMDDEQIGDRIVISELFRRQDAAGVGVSAMEYQTKLSDAQFEHTQSIFNELFELPIKISDKRGLTVAEIRAKARKVKVETPDLGLIVLDYLQLVKPSDAGNRNHALVVGEIVRELRDLAGELDLPIILLSQLNRGVESRDNKRPMMSDLRDSGNIEEFADVVMFLYRDDYYYPERAAEEGTEGVVEVIFAKQRKGPTGVAKLRFVREYQRFIDESDRAMR